MLKILDLPATRAVSPRVPLTIQSSRPGKVVIHDGQGRRYWQGQIPAGEPGITIKPGGALGSHMVLLLSEEGVLLDQATFQLQAKTRLRDAGGDFARLHDLAYFTMEKWKEDHVAWLDGKFYFYYVRWLRDHVHTMKGMKWFDDRLKSAIELYADTQREDGMIYDRIADYREVTSEGANWRDVEFAEGNFSKPIQNGARRMERIPVENDVEYLFLEGLYYTWKATGDTDWMSGLLDNAIRAVRYSTSDPYRWSEKYGLLKRGYTIDTWDFQSKDDAARSGSPMRISLGKTEFNVMHGDNTGMAVGCAYLAEMLAAAGRTEEADEFRQLGVDLQKRLDDLAWNGKFYTHQVPENPEVERDFGIDPRTQVSLSNAYDINRRINPEHARAIVQTYQRIRQEMPETSPGEFYQIYPPFEKGFGGHNAKWHYMNGGVTTIVAGELARGAFQHGFEEYGADILRRVSQWGQEHGDYLHCCLRGAAPEVPERTFSVLDLRPVVNADFHNHGAEGVPAWAGEAGDNDLRNLPTGRQTFQGVEFEILDPAAHGRRGCLGLASHGGYVRQAKVAVGKNARSLYLLHARHGGGRREPGEPPVLPSAATGKLRIHYADGTVVTDDILQGTNIGSWFLPSDLKGKRRNSTGPCRVAWSGPNPEFPSVGVYVYALDNPSPEKEIARLEFLGPDNSAIWFVFGVTLSDAAASLPEDDVSYGIPDNWGAGAVMYALMEGLAGITDSGTAFDTATLSPRWLAAGVSEAEATGHYPASQGYLDYAYQMTDDGRELQLEFTSSAQMVHLKLLLPPDRQPAELLLDGRSVPFELVTVGDSRYVHCNVESCGVHSASLRLA